MSQGFTYEPYADVAKFMRAFGQKVRTNPTTDISENERILRARLVLEEALEFVAAMGFDAFVEPGHNGEEHDVQLSDTGNGIDLVEAADAIGDVLVVTYGSGHTLGIPTADVFAEVHRSNMDKLGPDGKPIVREDGKVIKPEGWQKPDIAGALYGLAVG